MRVLAISALALAVAALKDCTYTCWNSPTDVTRYAACTGTSLAPAAPIAGDFVQEMCSECPHQTYRIKGYWPAAGATNWAWVYPSALTNPRSCTVEELAAVTNMTDLEETKDALMTNTLSSIALNNDALEASIGAAGGPCATACLKPGMYTVKQPGGGTVRGGINDDGCIDHHFQGWLLTGQQFAVASMCEGETDCCWCKGHAYGDINNVGSIECGELG